jgi:hypothetical protein
VSDRSGSAPARVALHSSRLWALFHFRLTELLFRNTMVADDRGISMIKVGFWLTPWIRDDEHLPMSHIAEVTHGRGLLWDRIIVESSGGLNPLVIEGLPKGPARSFVEYVRTRMNEAPAADRNAPRGGPAR